MNFKDQPWYLEKACRAQFMQHGFPCLAMRTPGLGAWCGYVAVGGTHPAFGKENVDLSVHGGITFHGPQNERHRFHPVNPERQLWFFGFDCAHWRDVTPALDVIESQLTSKELDPRGGMAMLANLMREGMPEHMRPTWKDLNFVKGQCEQMALQLHEMAPSALPEIQEIVWEVSEEEREEVVARFSLKS